MDFAEQFAKSRGESIQHEGRPVIPMFKREVAPSARVGVIWRSAIDSPVQGIRIKLRGGAMMIDGKELNDVVLWRDSAPNEVAITCVLPRSGELRVWNCWRNADRVMDAWLGNAGMQVARADGRSVVLECNSRSQITFRDLVFELSFG